MTEQRRTQGGTATSRLRSVRKAERRPVKARLALGGPSGAGKTWTALSIASALAPGGTICLIDTEANEPDGTAAELYADVYDFEVLPWDPPYDPRDLAVTVTDASRHYDVVIIDSATHFWRGQGGTLDISGGRFGGWQVATPAQEDLIASILRSDAHVITCMRAKEQYLVTESNGRQEVQKMGLGMVQRDDMEYEFQVVAMLGMDHRLDIGKTRCAPLAGRSFGPDHEHEMASIYATWLATGIDLARMVDVDAVKQAIRAISTETEIRNAAIRDFKEAFGITDALTRTVLPDVWAWIAARRGMDDHPFEAIEDNPALCAVCDTPIVAAWHRVDADKIPAAPQAEPDPAGPEPPAGSDEAPDTGDAEDEAWRQEATSGPTLPDVAPHDAAGDDGTLPGTEPLVGAGRRRR